jgi:cytochrome c-type biogenesis protein CcmH/NrfG
MGQPETAVSELEKAVVDQPDLVPAYYQLGRAYRVLGQAHKSASAFATFNNLKKANGRREEDFIKLADKELDGP